MLKQQRVAMVVVGVVVLILVMGGAWLFSGPDDGIEYDKPYALAFSGPVEIEIAGQVIAGRQFDFADRNLPTTSIVVPNGDPRGIPLVVRDPNLPLMKTTDGKLMGTVKKVWVKVPERTLEGEFYPAYEYPQWRYHLAVEAPVTHVPRVIPKR